MNEISNTIATMTSKEIATLTGKKHSNVLRDIRNMIEELGDSNLNPKQYQSFTLDNGMTDYVQLDKELTITLTSGYSIKQRNAIVKRWLELESQQAPMINFSNPAEAARAWADQYEARLLAERTKAEIGSRREATAMATASVATKRVTKLEQELDRSKLYCSIKRMQMVHHGQKFDWRLLKSTSVEMGLEPIDVFDQNYGTVKAYHADVWMEAYAISSE